MIGYYAHHQGSGHIVRAAAVASRLRSELTLLTSADLGLATLPSHVQVVKLARDDLATSVRQPDAGGVLHWAPVHDIGLRRRMAQIARWVDEAAPRLFVVDVSVEVALFVRLLGVPVVVVAMPGRRTDRPHRAAYDSAEALLAPWPARFADPTWEQGWLDKTWHVGAFSRNDGRAAPGWPPVPSQPPGRRRVHVLWGFGGSDISAEDIEAARRTTPGWTWTLSGPGHRVSPQLIRSALHHADVVVTHAGQNAVADVAAAGRPAVVVAQRRPYDEQLHTARLLDSAGLAVGLDAWPGASEWPRLLGRALELGGGRWTEWADGHGATRAAAHLDDLHDRLDAAIPQSESLQCAPRS